MRMPLKKILRWFVHFAAASIAMYLLTTYILDAGKSKPAIEKFLESDRKLAAQVGDVSETKLVKRVSVAASDSSSPYRLYTFMVKGNKATATVVVHVDQTGPQEHFSINRLDFD